MPSGNLRYAAGYPARHGQAVDLCQRRGLLTDALEKLGGGVEVGAVAGVLIGVELDFCGDDSGTLLHGISGRHAGSESASRILLAILALVAPGIMFCVLVHG